MRALRRCAPTAIALLVLAAGVRAQEAAPRCLPEELRMRVKFAEPKQLAEALSALEAARKRETKAEILARRFRDAGCAEVEEQPGAGLAAPNLVCRLPGASDRTIAIGSSPEFDGWASAALLPEIARAVASAPREHGYALALLSRSVEATPAGARAFADSDAASTALFLHVGSLGTGKAKIGPEADERQACALRELAAALGTSIEAVLGWKQLNVPCPGTALLGMAQRPLANCESASFVRFLDVDPFMRAGVPVLGVYAFPKRDATSFSQPEPARLDPAAYVATYRLVAAYAVVLDQLLAAERR